MKPLRLIFFAALGLIVHASPEPDLSKAKAAVIDWASVYAKMDEMSEAGLAWAEAEAISKRQ